ncbi:HRSL1 enzyme, partial [Thryothorus ludovicianus]|nr:HRSL1 enzyme [Thryothorus ludovicianus]
MGDDMRHPQPGDLIEIDRPLCQHWVLYMGDGDVVHLSPIDEGAPSVSGSSASIQATRAKVKKEKLLDVVKDNTWCIKNKYDRSHTPLPAEKIIWCAECCIGREVLYDVLGSNCEHFVTMLRYGEPLSEQV